MQALAEGRLHFQLACVGILVELETAAILDATEHRDQARERLADAVRAKQSIDDLLLVARPRQIDDLPDRGRLRQAFRGQPEFSRRTVEEHLEGNQQHLHKTEIFEEALGKTDRPKGPPKTNPIESGKNSVAAPRMLAYKCLHGMSWFGEWLVANSLYPTRHAFPFGCGHRPRCVDHCRRSAAEHETLHRGRFTVDEYHRMMETGILNDE